MYALSGVLAPGTVMSMYSPCRGDFSFAAFASCSPGGSPPSFDASTARVTWHRPTHRANAAEKRWMVFMAWTYTPGEKDVHRPDAEDARRDRGWKIEN